MTVERETALTDDEYREVSNDLAFVTAIMLRIPLERFITRALDAQEALGSPPAVGSPESATFVKVQNGISTLIRTATAMRVCQEELRRMYDEAMRERHDDRRAPDPNEL